MKNKRPNVAAGRLGDLSLAARSSQSGGRRPASYSAERLGIVSDSESCEPETQEPGVVPQDVPQAGAAEASAHAWMPEQPLPAAEPDRHSQLAEHFALVPEAPWKDTPAAASSADDKAWPAGLRRWLPDGPRGGLAMAGAAACVMLVVLVLVWWFGDETVDPQQAAAAGGARPGILSSQARPADRAGVSQARDPSARKPPRINVTTGARPGLPRRRPLGLPRRRLAAGKPPPLRATSPPSARTPTSRPRRTVATTSRPASAAPRPSRTTSTKPAAVPPGSSRPGPPPAIRVSCVMEGPSGPAAIINGNCVTVGDTVGGARIIAIGQFTIEVEYKGHKHLIGVSAPSSAAPAAADEEHDATEEAGEGSEETSDEQ